MRCYPLALCLATSVLVLGCTPAPRVASSVDYKLPDILEVQNELFVDAPFETVWDALVEQLAKSFYVINNIEKASRIINVSFASESPQEYIDCGTSHRRYSRKSEDLKYDYPVASSCSYKSGGNRGRMAITYDMRRSTSLEGRVNIYVAPKDNGTLITVNARYVLSIDVSGRYVVEDPLGNEYGQATPTLSSHSFNTNEPNQINLGTDADPIYGACVSTGRLESDILGMVAPLVQQPN